MKRARLALAIAVVASLCGACTSSSQRSADASDAMKPSPRMGSSDTLGMAMFSHEASRISLARRRELTRFASVETAPE